MEETYHVKQDEFTERLWKSIKENLKDTDEITIIVKSPESSNEWSDDRKKAFFDLFGSWQGDESADDLIKTIYDSRVNSTREIDL